MFTLKSNNIKINIAIRVYVKTKSDNFKVKRHMAYIQKKKLCIFFDMYNLFFSNGYINKTMS